MTKSAPQSTAAHAVEESFAAQAAQLCQIYGIPAKYGRLYALLFLTPRPMSLSELAERSANAKSTTSSAMRTMERYRFVRRLPRGSDRKDYYEVVADPRQIIRDWVRMFLAPEMAVGAQMADGLDAGVSALASAAAYGPQERSILEQRAQFMRRSLAEGQQLITRLLAMTEPKTPSS